MTNYAIDLSVLKLDQTVYGYTIVNLDTNSHLTEEVYKLAQYFYKELDYDRPPFERNGRIEEPYKAILFTERTYDNPDDVQESPPYSRIFGACLFDQSLPIKGNTDWVLKWIWFHPFFRHRGKLKEYWEYLERDFGDFYIHSPVSCDMNRFLDKYGDNHIIIP